MVTAYLGLLALIGAQRLAELVISRRHAFRAFARGGVESGARDLPVMKLLHTAFLLSCAVEAIWRGRPFQPWLGLPMLGGVVAAQGLRLWSMRALGPWWNTRIITAPGMPRVTHGPYRLLRHPNYLAVAIEGVAIPLVYGAWGTALWFSVANAAFLRRRIRCEESALDRHATRGGGRAAIAANTRCDALRVEGA